MPLELLQYFKFAGEVFPVNPKYAEIFGNRCYPDIEAVPKAADLVVLAIAAPEVTSMLRRCHARGIPSAIVYASGFAEAGEQGLALQRELEAFVRESGMVVAGPNCMGFANLNRHAYTAFASIFKKVPPQTVPGRVSLVTQSGNVCSAVFGEIRQRGVPVSHFINTGNEACLEFSEYLEFLAADDETDTVVGYIEQLRDGSRFVQAALDLARRGKPLIVFKAGESDKGSEAVRSHNSALAGEQALYKAAFRQVNAIQAEDFAQMGDLAWLSGFRARAGGRRVAVLSISGALGAIISDKLIAAGLEVPTLSAGIQQALREGIPDYGMVANPVDLTGNIVNHPDFVRTIFSILATTDEIDAVIVYAPGYLMDRMADALAEMGQKHRRLFVGIDTGAGSSYERLGAAGVPVFNDLGRAMRALSPFLHWMARRETVGRWAALRDGMPALHSGVAA
ncbi:MAG: CoA-binding protein, partial [Desulfobacterales bacterium]|nr:CoA-binding protein [Desulfobacterales bacterium]